mmetsp:Transcript_8986/g.6828  ORF Transcript_8986/g.6828 Transcript_8986/m.6828 type:complete len:88 (+) Transcript_8986:95-358(+)
MHQQCQQRRPLYSAPARRGDIACGDWSSGGERSQGRQHTPDPCQIGATSTPQSWEDRGLPRWVTVGVKIIYLSPNGLSQNGYGPLAT